MGGTCQQRIFLINLDNLYLNVLAKTQIKKSHEASDEFLAEINKGTEPTTQVSRRHEQLSLSCNSFFIAIHVCSIITIFKKYETVMLFYEEIEHCVLFIFLGYKT